MKILYVVTARGGSKGVARKNIREIGGLPLVAYKIIAAQRTDGEKRIITSTDDEEIARVCEKFGAEVPYLRPENLATDEANSMDVVFDVVNWIRENDESIYDYVCLLEPSSPFATYKDLNAAINILKKSEVDTLLGMKEAEVSTQFVHSLDEHGKLSHFYHAIKCMQDVRRQSQKVQYTMNGCMYFAKFDYFIKHKSFHSVNSLPYVMPAEASVEIDNMTDYYYAKFLVDNGIIDTKPWK